MQTTTASAIIKALALAAKAKDKAERNAATWMQTATASAIIKALALAAKAKDKAERNAATWMQTATASAIIKATVNNIAAEATDKAKVKDADKAAGEQQT